MYDKFSQAQPEEVPIGSCRCGEVRATLEEMKAICGKAFDGTQDDNVFYVFYRGHIISLHDQLKKHGESGKYTPKTHIEWLICCKARNAHWLVMDAIDQLRFGK